MDIISSPRQVIKNANLLPFLSILIKEERIKLGLSQEDLARKIGLGLKTLRKIEQGDLNVNFIKLNYLLNFFGKGLQASDLLTTPKQKKPIVLKRDFILKSLGHLYPILKIKYKATALALFGSYAKEQATPHSDIDILIDFETDISLETEGEIQLILENLFLGSKVDLSFKKNLHQALVEEIEESKIDVA
jgi:uncharacterized protein